MANNIIQVPASLIIAKYIAQKQITKKSSVATGFSIVQEAGINYRGATLTMTYAHQNDYDYSNRYLLTIQAQVLLDLSAAGKPLTVKFPDFLRPGETSQLGMFTVPYLPAGDWHETTHPMAITVTPELTANPAAVLSITIFLNQSHDEQIFFQIPKPWYPFSYTTHTMDMGGAEYITLDTPPFVDIDINELLKNPTRIAADAEGSVLYVLHKNVSQ